VGNCRVDSSGDPREVSVHAVVVRVTISDREAAQQRLNQEVVPAVSQAPGFQAGYWMQKDNTGLSVVIFDSEDSAKQGAERAREMTQNIDAVSLEGVEVREVVAHA
jgi:heme-degrading monooxygenase HmoA